MKKYIALIAFLAASLVFAATPSKEEGSQDLSQKEAPLLIVDQKPAVCPFCSEKKVTTILWGKPKMTPELEKKVSLGEMSLGGCVIPENAPTWKCAHCGASFFESQKATMPPTQKGEVLNAIQKNIQNYQKNPKLQKD